MSTTYTAWSYDAMTGPSWCICNDEGAIADVWTNEPDARLIAAAPEMLAALECAETVLILLRVEADRLGCHGGRVLAKVQTAIRKAKEGK
jgi:hypothetical protein